MRGNTEGVHIDRQREGTAHQIIAHARRDIDVRLHSKGRRHLDLRNGAGGRRSEVDAHGGLLRFGFAIGMEVGLQHQVRIGRQMVRDARGQEFRRGAGNPSTEAAGDGSRW